MEIFSSPRGSGVWLMSISGRRMKIPNPAMIVEEQGKEFDERQDIVWPPAARTLLC